MCTTTSGGDNARERTAGDIGKQLEHGLNAEARPNFGSYMVHAHTMADDGDAAGGASCLGLYGDMPVFSTHSPDQPYAAYAAHVCVDLQLPDGDATLFAQDALHAFAASVAGADTG